MKKQLTERQAWLKLASIWRKPVKCQCEGCQGRRNVYIAGGHDGLCGCLAGLDVSEKVRDVMGRKIFAVNNKMLKWPTTLAGAKSRVAFCMKQAQLLAPKKKKAVKRKKVKP